MNRFGDIDWSFKKLPAAYGYHIQQIVSLEKYQFIKVAEKNCHFPSEHGLRHDEFASIYIYTMESDKLPKEREGVWRGVPLNVGQIFTANQLLTWWTVNSYSSSNCTFYMIEALNGRNVSGYTAYEGEDDQQQSLASTMNNLQMKTIPKEKRQ
ncbi:hypothetical protein I4U23_022868 [Adineta vaga]|nr:hypothetical protein I4U23_022868 [Adineta vaga]